MLGKSAATCSSVYSKKKASAILGRMTDAFVRYLYRKHRPGAIALLSLKVLVACSFVSRQPDFLERDSGALDVVIQEELVRVRP
jgi:hypothetical protein